MMSKRIRDLPLVSDLPKAAGYLETSRLMDEETGARKSFKVSTESALVVPASQTTKGVAALATGEEASLWQDPNKVIPPEALGAAIAYLLQNRIIAGPGVVLEYSGGVLDISLEGGSGFSGEVEMAPNSSYYYEGAPIPGPYGDAWVSGTMDNSTPFNDGGGGQYTAPGSFPASGMGFVYDPNSNDVWFVFTFDGATGSETVLIEGVPSYPTLHSDDATFATNSVYGLGIFSWPAGTGGPPTDWLAQPLHSINVTVSG